MFREDKDGSYSAYVNSTNSGKKQRRDMKKRTVEDFEKTIKNCLKGISTEDEDVAYILEELDKESFLPKQLTASNGVIPNQVHTKEMKKILNMVAGTGNQEIAFITPGEDYDKDGTGKNTESGVIRMYNGALYNSMSLSLEDEEDITDPDEPANEGDSEDPENPDNGENTTEE